MKNIILLFTFICLFTAKSYSENSETVTGEIVSVSNPCTTEPCLPGVVTAIQNDPTAFVLCINGYWHNGYSFTFEGKKYTEGDKVAITGIVSYKFDLNNNPYKEIKVESIEILHSGNPETLTGEIVRISNPCTTEPCLPGIVTAIENDTASFVLKINNGWLADISFTFEGKTYTEGDKVTITGIVFYKFDLNDNPYKEIKVESISHLPTYLQGVKTTSVSIQPKPSRKIHIISNNYEILGLDIFNVNGKNIYNSFSTVGVNFMITPAMDKGIYVVRINLTNNQSFTQTIIIP